MKLPPSQVAALVLAATLAACSDSSNGMGHVNLQVATRSSSPMAAMATRPSALAAGEATIELGGDQIVLSQVEMVLRKVKFEGVGAGACEESGSLDVEGEPGDCGEFRAGPTLLDLPLGEGVVQTFSALVPVGVYHEVQFQIHRPTDNNDDAAFLAQHPDFKDVSIRVTGTYQKAGDPAPAPFLYTTDLTSVVNVGLESPVEVIAGATLDVTLDIDLTGWFADQTGGRLVDPAEALEGHPFDSMVEQNIRQSFHVFRDGNHDGAED
jgi:hypothetical protein